jgi:hypothetical protein
MSGSAYWQQARVTDAQLREAAAAVLAGNDAGGWTKAAPRQYPHQWSWDSAFIAIGWSHLHLRRAISEQQRLFDAQWKTGKIPYIVYDESAPADSYFPDSARWACSISPDAPVGPPHTGGLCQPPVHALGVARIWEVAEHEAADLRAQAGEYVQQVFPALLEWHRYLATYRDPERSGLVTIYHPWESGADNSPRWDDALSAVEVGDLPPYVRRDTQVVSDIAQRPSDSDYDRYLWLLELMKRNGYDEAAIQRNHPFQVKDVFFSAILVAANEALLGLCSVAEASRQDRAEILSWIDRGRRALAQCWDPRHELCLDYDLRSGARHNRRTFAGLSPLIAGGLPSALHTALLDQLDSTSFLGNPALRLPVITSTSPVDEAFDHRNYWRGPTWPVINWLFWQSLRRAGEQSRAQRLREASLEQIRAAGFHEYFSPISGEPLGSPDQSWTAAVVLDWLAA